MVQCTYLSMFIYIFIWKVENLTVNFIILNDTLFIYSTGMVGIIIGILFVSCVVMCLRIKKLKKAADCSSRPNIYIPSYRSDFVPPSKRRLE